MNWEAIGAVLTASARVAWTRRTGRLAQLLMALSPSHTGCGPGVPLGVPTQRTGQHERALVGT